MKLTPYCFPCILEDVIEAGSLLLSEKSLEELSIRAVDILNKADSQRIPSYYITKVHRELKALSKKEPFSEKREECNRICFDIARNLKNEELFLWTVWANSLDFRTAGRGYRFHPEVIEKELRNRVREGLAVDNRGEVFKEIERAKRILYILDNVGEIAFDRFFIERFLRGKNIITSVRGGMITSDVVYKDAENVGLDKIVDKIITSGPDTLGILYEELSLELREGFKWADLVIAKGQANFYFFSEYRDITKAKVVLLFTTKCNPIAEIFNKNGKVGIATVL